MQSYTGPGFNLAPALGPQVRAEKDKPLKLPAGAVLPFKAHSHKRTMVGGPPSPLITYLSFKSPSGPALEDVQVDFLIQATQATLAPIADPIGASGSPKRKRHDG